MLPLLQKAAFDSAGFMLLVHASISIMFIGLNFLDLFGGISWIAKPDGQSHIASDFCKGFEILYAARTC